MHVCLPKAIHLVIQGSEACSPLFVWLALSSPCLWLTGAEEGETELIKLGDSCFRFVSLWGPRTSRMTPSLGVLFHSYLRPLPRFLSFYCVSAANLGGVSCCTWLPRLLLTLHSSQVLSPTAFDHSVFSDYYWQVCGYQIYMLLPELYVSHDL